VIQQCYLQKIEKAISK